MDFRSKLAHQEVLGMLLAWSMIGRQVCREAPYHLAHVKGHLTFEVILRIQEPKEFWKQQEQYSEEHHSVDKGQITGGQFCGLTISYQFKII